MGEPFGHGVDGNDDRAALYWNNRELARSQAECLLKLASYRADEIKAPYSCFIYARYEVTESSVRHEIDEIVEPNVQGELQSELIAKMESGFSDWAKRFCGPGVYLDGFSFGNFEYNFKIGEGLDLPERDMEILESLGLIRRTTIHLDYDHLPSGYSWVFASYCYLTGMGVDFVSICEPEMISKFKSMEESFKSANLDRRMD